MTEKKLIELAKELKNSEPPCFVFSTFDWIAQQENDLLLKKQLNSNSVKHGTL